MKICVIGTGYVGLVTGACFAEMGHEVICIDTNQQKIDDLLKGKIPIYEPGLQEIVNRTSLEGRLAFSTSLKDSVFGVSIFFIAVGTPPGEDGSADLKYVLAVAAELGKYITEYSVIVNKSTVPVGTGELVRSCISQQLEARKENIEFDVVSNPEFLKEGAAVSDFMSPDRIIIGSESDRAFTLMQELYAPFVRNHPRTIKMAIRDAEMTKYASNAMLATKISFMNEVAALCDILNVDVESVRVGIGSDDRIGFHFIYPGAGYGGSCFPKDVQALLGMARANEFDSLLLRAVEQRNAIQKNVLFEKLCNFFGGASAVAGKTVAVWGLAFKPGTDDMREAPSKTLIASLVRAGVHVKAFDPVATEVARREMADIEGQGSLVFADAQYEATIGADALILVTEWKPFRHPDFKTLSALMNGRVIIDGRNQYDPAHVKSVGFSYIGIGRR